MRLFKDIPHLSLVETLDEFTSTISGDGSFTHLNHLSYYNLLINACVRYDAANTSTPLTEFRQPLQVQSHLEMPRILVQLGHTQRT